MATSRDWDELVWAWQGWRNESSRQMPPMYIEFVDLLNEAAVLNGKTLSCYHHRPQTKLLEGNVFTGVCLCIGGRVSLVPGPFWGIGYLWFHVLSGVVGYLGGRVSER